MVNIKYNHLLYFLTKYLLINGNLSELSTLEVTILFFRFYNICWVIHTIFEIKKHKITLFCILELSRNK